MNIRSDVAERVPLCLFANEGEIMWLPPLEPAGTECCPWLGRPLSPSPSVWKAEQKPSSCSWSASIWKPRGCSERRQNVMLAAFNGLLVSEKLSLRGGKLEASKDQQEAGSEWRDTAPRRELNTLKVAIKAKECLAWSGHHSGHILETYRYAKGTVSTPMLKGLLAYC